jgi:hypothetical protein
MLAAATLLSRFTAAGILLHLARMNMVVRDEFGIRMYLDMCWAAQQANNARTQAVVRARKAYARGGRWLSGNRPPYGFKKVVDEHNERGWPSKFHFERDIDEHGGYRAWEVRRDICRWYLSGLSGWRIAERLSAMHVPTSGTLWGRSNANSSWAAITIYEMLADPINEGIGMAFRTEVREWKTSAKHKTRKQQVDVAPDKQIQIKGAVAADAIILTHEEAESIRAKLKRGKKASPRRASEHALSHLLIGAMARCAMPSTDDPSQPCGGSLRLKGNGHGHAMRYVCTRHEQQPHRCPGLSVGARQLDVLVWEQVFEKLIFSEQLEAQAKEQARLDTTIDDPASELRRLQGIRDEQKRKRANFLEGVGMAQDADTRAELIHSADKAKALIQDAEAQIAGLAQAADDDAHRRAVLGNVAYQVGRHLNRLLQLDIFNVDDIQSMRTICRSLGVQPTVRIEEGASEPEVIMHFNLGAATGVPWFPEHDTDPITEADAAFNASMLIAARERLSSRFAPGVSEYGSR